MGDVNESQPSTSTGAELPEQQLVAGVTIGAGRYRLLAPHGGIAGQQFWHATDTVLDRQVALTLVTDKHDDPADVRARLARLGRIECAGLALPLDIVDSPDGTIAVAEWTPGRPLDEIAHADVAPLAAARATKALAEAADIAHCGGGVLSIDAPERIRISADGNAVLAFPAPTAVAAPRSDVRGLGAVLYALLTGQWPQGEAPQAPHVLRPEVPYEISTVATRALDGSVTTAATVARILEHALDRSAGTRPATAVAPAVAAAPPADNSWLRKVTVLAAAVLVLALAAWFAIAQIGGGAAEPSASERSASVPASSAPAAPPAPVVSSTSPAAQTPAPIDNRSNFSLPVVGAVTGAGSTFAFPLIGRWALRWWPDVRPMVSDVVGAAPDNHGTDVALPLCAQEDPVLKPRPSDGRRVACHVAQGDLPARKAA